MSEEVKWSFETIEQAARFVDFIIKTNRGYTAKQTAADPCEVLLSDSLSSKQSIFSAVAHDDCLIQIMKSFQFGWNAANAGDAAALRQEVEDLRDELRWCEEDKKDALKALGYEVVE